MNKGDLTLDTCTISGNYGFWAGGIASYESLLGSGVTGTISCRNSVIAGNQSHDLGGGLFLSGDNEFVGCTITENNADFGNGGGVLNAGLTRFVSCTLSGNSSYSSGSAVQCEYFGLPSEVEFDHCTIVSNRWGGIDLGGVFAAMMVQWCVLGTVLSPSTKAKECKALCIR